MAAAATLPAMPASLRFPDNNYQPKQSHRQQQPFDARLLTSKLEAHQRRQTGQHMPSQPRDASKRASYVPRSAALHFAATTSPIKDETTSKSVRRAQSMYIHEKPDPPAEMKPSGVNPKQLQAALNMGMSESEAATSAVVVDVPKRKAASPDMLKRRKSFFDRARREPKDRSLSPPHDKSESQHETPMRSYKPGDAAKRNAMKRQSQMFSPPPAWQSATNEPGQPREYNLDFGDRLDKLREERDSADIENDEAIGARRPPFVPHDRPNWAQESQCGEDMRRHLPLRKKKTTGDAREDARRALDGNAGSNVRPQQSRTRQTSLPDNNNLVSDAVKLIKVQEKQKRRQTIMGFFKRF